MKILRVCKKGIQMFLDAFSISPFQPGFYKKVSAGPHATSESLALEVARLTSSYHFCHFRMVIASLLLSLCNDHDVTPSDHSTSPILSRRSPRAMQLSFSSPTLLEYRNLFNIFCRYQRGFKQQFKVSAKSVKLSLRTLPVSFHAPGPDSVFKEQPRATMF
jgi:hypothetical protein